MGNNISDNIDTWDLVIRPRNKWYHLELREIWRYRDLMFLFVKRDFIAQYRQTVLGPLWHFISPIFSTLIYTLVFGNIAGLSTDGTPQMVFYMSGVTIWNYFASTLNATGSTFISNAGIFGKVYFPRLVAPLATTMSRTIAFGIQFLMLLVLIIYHKLNGQMPDMAWHRMLYLPFLLLLTSGTALGLGIIISSITTKYRDLNVFMGFGVGLLMYASPVIYPASSVPEQYRPFLEWNPLTPVIEAFRWICTGTGTFTIASLGYSIAFMLVVGFLGIVMFRKVEKTFMDTV